MSKTSLSFVFAAMICAPALGQSDYKVIHSFSGYPNDGQSPVSSIVFDKAGNMYGSTPGGGDQTGCGDLGCGTVYELSPDGHGNWMETVLYNFCSNYNGLCLDGAYPNGLTIDAAGNLYGTTFSGGSGYVYLTGPGVAFELSPPAQKSGAWTETVLYNFCSDFSNGSCLDGWVGVVKPLVLDEAGDLYGVTALGGTGHVTGGEGLVFKLSRGYAGWEEMILRNFCTQGGVDECPDGYQPNGVTFDQSGNLYGTTGYSGNINKLAGGTLFELTPSMSAWKYHLLATIPPSSKVSNPPAPVSFDSAGNLYGTLAATDGGVFRINARTKKTSLFSFNSTDGYEPLGGVYVDNMSKVLYGTALLGGAHGEGTIYAIDSAGHESVLYSFCSQNGCADGRGPWATPTPDGEGNLYGTAQGGGAYGPGVVFQVKP